MRLRYINLWEALFPSHFRSEVWRRISGTAGMTMLFAAVGLGLALASWSADDPSFNHATATPASNWLGQPGAIVADILMQAFGLGAFAVVLVFAGWGWRLAAGGTLARPGRRVLSTLVATLLIGGFVSSLSPMESWPLTTGLGGVAGDAVASVLAWPLGIFGSAVGPEAEAIFAAIVALGAVLLLIHAGGLVGRGPAKSRKGRKSPKSEAAEEVAPYSLLDAFRLGLGALIHFVWSLFAVTRRIVRWAWQLIGGRGSVDPQARLKLAMERAEHDDLVWSEPNDLYAPPAADDPDHADAFDADDEVEDPAIARARRGGPVAYLRNLLSMDETEPHPPQSRAEPALFAGSFEDDIDDEDALLHAEPALEDEIEEQPKPRKRRAKPVGDDYCLPPLTLLSEAPPRNARDQMSPEMLMENARLLEGVLDDFGVRGEIINVRPGPVVTLYELEPAPGLKSSRVIGLADDIARSMSAVSARVAVVPGRNAIGIELPNEKRETVFLREIFASGIFAQSKHKLALSLGKDIGGEPIVTDLARMPHLLIAGTTGSGKSVGINTMILSLLFRMTPEQCKLIMIDPKMLELSVYDGIPHLLTPVVTDPKKAVVALKWTVREMEERYKNMSKLGVRNIDGFNKRVAEANAKGETLSRTVQTGFDSETGQPVYETEDMELEPMPYIVVVVDEMADLMMVAGKDIEGAIQRLAQMARAAGIHIVMATQRPSVDVITGTIKANFPTRISFQVTSKIDSRTILGEQGAEQLLGQGDMLYMAGGGRISRVHGAFVSDEEVEASVQYLKRQGVPQYLDAVTEEPAEEIDGAGMPGGGGGGSEANSLYDQAVAIVARDRKASTSYIQRRLQIGYNRAATIIEQMEQEGVVGPANHAGKREILVPEPSFEE